MGANPGHKNHGDGSSGVLNNPLKDLTKPELNGEWFFLTIRITYFNNSHVSKVANCLINTIDRLLVKW